MNEIFCFLDWVRRCETNMHSCPLAATDETKNIMKKITAMTDTLTPLYKDSERRRFFIKFPAPSFEEYKEHEKEYWDEDEPKPDEKQLKNDFRSEFPEPWKWFEIFVIHIPKDSRREEFIGIFVNNTYVLAMNDPNQRDHYQADLSDFASVLFEKIENTHESVKNGTYNTEVAENLPYENRTGIITRKDWFAIFTAERKAFRKNLSDEDITLFLEEVSKQTDIPDGSYDRMTARRYFEAAAAAISSTRYDKKAFSYRFKEEKEEKERYKGLTPREIYCSSADGRDDGLTNLPLDDPDAFDEWNDQKGPYYIMNGHHPWEIRGSMSLSHSIHLYPTHKDSRWFFTLSGSAYSTCRITVKYYLAMKTSGFPVILSDADVITARFRETDNIGILPSYEYSPFSTNIPSVFDGLNVNDCQELPYEEEGKENRENVIKHTKWLNEPKIQIIKESKAENTL